MTWLLRLMTGLRSEREDLATALRQEQTARRLAEHERTEAQRLQRVAEIHAGALAGELAVTKSDLEAAKRVLAQPLSLGDYQEGRTHDLRAVRQASLQRGTRRPRSRPLDTNRLRTCGVLYPL